LAKRIDLPRKRPMLPKENCSVCGDKLTKLNTYKYAGYTRTQCKPCRKEKADKARAERKKRIEQFRYF
tara:strand:+ start:792 stop:995 length:204 start_codon:yes stop_codon:yes gene_type:complete